LRTRVIEDIISNVDSWRIDGINEHEKACLGFFSNELLQSSMRKLIPIQNLNFDMISFFFRKSAIPPLPKPGHTLI